MTYPSYPHVWRKGTVVTKVYKVYGHSWSNAPLYFVRTGEARPPKKGEWYLSGAIPQAYEATHDMEDDWFIVVRIDPPPKTLEKDGFRYRLEGPA